MSDNTFLKRLQSLKGAVDKAKNREIEMSVHQAFDLLLEAMIDEEKRKHEETN